MMLIIGSSGKLGRQLEKAFPEALAPKHEELDVKDRGEVESYIKKFRPHTIIHAAALTNVRQCEIDKKSTWDTNVVGTENLVGACASVVPNCYFVYMSTACVFYGDRGDYIETDIPNPKNFYSFTKLLGEFIVKKLSNHLIIRTNFVERGEWPYEKAFIDRFGTYLFADDLTLAIKEVIGKKLAGVVHVAGDKKFSMFELAKLTTPNVKPMTMKEADLPLTQDMTLRSIRIKPYKLTI
ncbi:MAG: sugar nucleotide-binding protein [Candidatus Aenigmarchaeota archaeon]|nr:sugar nucleotide-binding protein [Candidatus Aenigmarchaeota archaeon]